MSSSSLVLKRTSLATSSLHPIQPTNEYFNKVQPRSSAERDNSQLLHTALKAASTDIAHRLLDYASLDKLDCEASCILIALANHEYSLSINNKNIKPKKPIKEVQQQKVVEEEEVKEVVESVIPVTTMKTPIKATTMKPKNDPIMLLMAAAEVVNASDKKKKRTYRNDSMDDYPQGRYYRKSEDNTTANKRIRTSPPTPAPSYTTSDNWRNSNKYKNNDHRSSTREQADPSMDTMTNNSFSRQYHSMKQNPKIKQNALHTYITYMIYNDLAHGGAVKMQQYQQQQQQSTPPPPPPIQSNKPNYEPTSCKYSSSIYNNSSSTSKYHQPPPAPPPRSDYYSSTTPTNSEHKPSLSSSASSAATSSLSDPPTTVPWYSAPPSEPTVVNNNRPAIINHDDRSILSRPLTAFLWNNDTSPLDNNGRKEVMILPPLGAPTTTTTTTKLSSTSAYDRLPPV